MKRSIDLPPSDARKAKVVKLRYFVGFSFEETAEVLGISLIRPLFRPAGVFTSP